MYVPFEEFPGIEKDKKYCSKVKKNLSASPNLPVLIFFFYKLQLLPGTGTNTNFCGFFCLFCLNFSLLDPDPGGKMDADPCGSGSTAPQDTGIPVFFLSSY